MKTYFTGLDILRFLAALGVVNFHYFLGLTDKLSWYRYGNLGVQLFFMISGFVIAQSVAHASLKTFAIGRFIRLFPIFWILCSVTYIFTLLMPNGVPVSFPEYLISMTMLGDKLSAALGYGGIVDPSYWTLAVELIFYTAIGIFVALFSWKNIRYFLWGWLFVSALSFLCSLDQTFLAKLLLVRHASYFILGVTLMLILTDTSSVRQKAIDKLLFIVTLVYSTCISFVALPPYFIPNKLDDILIAAMHPVLFALMCIFIYISRYITNQKHIRIYAAIGGMTYPLYLLHQTIGRTLLDYFKDYATHITRGMILMLVMILISYVVYVYDKKIRGYLTKKLLPGK